MCGAEISRQQSATFPDAIRLLLAVVVVPAPDIIADQNRREIDVDVDGNVQRKNIAPLCLLLYLFVGLSCRLSSVYSMVACLNWMEWEDSVQAYTFSAPKISSMLTMCGNERKLECATDKLA